MTTTTRKTADERRAAVLDAATKEFAAKGLHGASTEDIARMAGISQPYLFRLFGTKKELYLAASRRAIDHLYEVFEDASAGKAGADALHAMGDAYETVMSDRDRLMLMLKCWASCDDPDICEVVRGAWRNLVDLAERRSGESPEVVSTFFSKGALLTILMGMEAFTRPEPWSNRLIEGCQAGLTE
ncbi:tetR-type regulatory protein [Gaiella occulta]|uniref:TetR-type regulatory protein n=1 Tax=Gaiella occulta TaxID=1002870 RepID=A0A7M2YW60_9ACTN|nr:TetR/AcrR family transcriptional regulator [Gaiella occulta]RDI74245.1 tetR-type regulatory protein [Gaiella occulta]